MEFSHRGWRKFVPLFPIIRHESSHPIPDADFYARMGLNDDGSIKEKVIFKVGDLVECLADELWCCGISQEDTASLLGQVGHVGKIEHMFPDMVWSEFWKSDRPGRIVVKISDAPGQKVWPLQSLRKVK